MKRNRRPPLGGIGVPLSGFSRIRILDFSKLLPGPYATQVLADMGCRVTRVELPYFRDFTRDMPPKIRGVGYSYWAVNQGKKLLVLDFRKPAGMKKIQQLIKKADVLVEGFRPGLMDRIGLGFAEVRRMNPRLIYCSLSGYHRDGPWKRKAGHDLNFQAVSGFLGLGDSDGRIAFPSLQLADLSGGMAAVAGILGALLERAKTGRGRHVQISLAETLHSWLCIPQSYMKASGEDPSLGRYWWSGAHPFYRLYDTADSRKIAVAAIEKRFALALLDALGLGVLNDLTDHPIANGEKLSRELQRVFRSRTLVEWERRLQDKDVCVTGVQTLKEAADFMSREH